MGETQALARLRSTEAGAARLLDVLPAHLIPGGGPLSSMTMWWVLSLSKAEWVVEGGGDEADRLGWVSGAGGRLVLRKSMPVLSGVGPLAESECFSLI